MRAIYSPDELDAGSVPLTIDFKSRIGKIDWYSPDIGEARSAAIDFGSRRLRRRSIADFLGTLTAQALESDHLLYAPIGRFSYWRERYRLARYVFLGPAADEEPIRIGIFAAIHGDEPESADALIAFLLRLHREPERARGYQIFAYPICNPTGFEDDSHLSRSGHDLNHEFWQGSRQAEAYYIEREIGVLDFHGVIALHAGPREGFYAYSRSRTLTESLVLPALDAAQKFLPPSNASARSECPAAEATGRTCHEGVLIHPSEISSAPFEILLETPQSAPPESQVAATVGALDRILAEYRPFLATQQNI